MISLNNKDIPKVFPLDQRMAREVSNRTITFCHPIRKCTIGKQEGGGTKIGFSPQMRESKKIEREREDLVIFIAPYFVPQEEFFLNWIHLVHPSLSFDQLSNLPIVDYPYLLYKLVMLIKNFWFVHTNMCFWPPHYLFYYFKNYEVVRF